MKRAIVITVAVGAAVVGVSTPVAAAPPTNGCATENRTSEGDHGMLYFAVSELTGYRVPGNHRRPGERREWRRLRLRRTDGQPDDTTRHTALPLLRQRARPCLVTR